jgi:hypothetical protein
MITNWDDLQKEMYPIKDYEDLRRRWQEAFAYPFVCSAYNFTLPEIADYTRRMLAEDTRNRYTDYAQRLVGTFYQLDSAGVPDIWHLLTQVETRQNFEIFTAETGLPAQDLIAVLKYLVYWVIPMKKQLSGLIREDVAMSDAVKALRPLGIRTNLGMLQRGMTLADRQFLSETSGVPEAIITELVNRADFSRMPWASKATISNFIGAGYRSLAELANADREDLYADFFRYGASIGKNLKLGNEIDSSYRIAQIVPAILKEDV